MIPIYLDSYLHSLNCLIFFSVSLLQGLPEQKLAKIVDCLEVVSALGFISICPSIQKISLVSI